MIHKIGAVLLVAGLVGLAWALSSPVGSHRDEWLHYPASLFLWGLALLVAT